MEAEPDKWDRAHIRQELRVFDHRLKQQTGEFLNHHERITTLEERLKEADAKLAEQAAKIGELAGELDDMKKKHETLCESLRPVWPEIKKLAGKNGKT